MLAKHRTDNRRRGRAALRALVPGVLAAAIAVGAVAAGLPGYVGGLLLVVGLAGLVRGTALAVDHRRLGGEVFMIRERGAVHRRRGTATALPWRDIEAVRISGRGRALRWLTGRDVIARVALRRGGSLPVTGFTHDARSLAEELAARAGGSPHAGADGPPDGRADVPSGGRQRSLRRRGEPATG